MIQLIQLTMEDLQDRINKAVDDSFEKHKTNFKPPPSDCWLTRKETIAVLKISYVTLSSWTKKGILSAYKIGNRVRYKNSQVEQALTKMK